MQTPTKRKTLRSILFANLLILLPAAAVAASNGMNGSSTGTAPQSGQQQSQGQNQQSSQVNQQKAPSNALVKKAQEALNQKQGTTLKVDGMMGKSTIDALKKYQRKHGLRVTGEIDNQTKHSLLNM